MSEAKVTEGRGNQMAKHGDDEHDCMAAGGRATQEAKAEKSDS